MQNELKPQKAGRIGDRVTGLLAQRLGQLESLKRVCNVAGAEQALIRKQLVKKLRTHRGCPQVPAITANLADPLVINSWLKQSRAALEHHRVQAACQRRDAWHSWLAQQKASGDKAVFAWLRQEESSWTPSGCSKQQQLEEADEAWWGLWGNKLADEAVEAAVAKVPAGIEMPKQGPISGRHLRKVALGMGRKAAGADGLQAADWQAWPKEHWNKLAELLDLCERRGQWPQQLLQAHVVLLCKGGKPVDKLQARPITILPLVYRAWAKIRAKQLKVWLEEHTTLLVGTREEAEFQAAILATTLALGKATGEGAGAVCVDFTKAYDGLDLVFLERALRRAGVSQQILGPAFAMYKAERAVRIGDAVGNPRSPTSGLPAGCPFATFFLAIVTQQWRLLRDMQAGPSVRTWVDDCTAFVQGETAAVELAGEAGRKAEEMQTMSLSVNRPKSGVLGSSARLTAAMRAAAGPLFGCTEALKDLGVIQGAGPAERAAAMARWATACSRLAKIAKLSVPMQAKGWHATSLTPCGGGSGTPCGKAARRPTTASCFGWGRSPSGPTRWLLCCSRRPARSAYWSRTATSPPTGSSGCGWRRTNATPWLHSARPWREPGCEATSRGGRWARRCWSSHCMHISSCGTAGSSKPRGSRTPAG
jgi:hypothetical protein